jgi:uncharacterized protein YndB with AHSA1/START domain
MTKTGERYAAARHQLLATSPGKLDRPDGPAETAPLVPRRDDLVVARTGRTWTAWFELLAAWGAADRPHREIARHLNHDLEVDNWWSQNITVEYEKAIGRRQVGQRSDGQFVATASKTIGVPVEVAFEAVVDDAIRDHWLDEPQVRLRDATPHRIARLDWPAWPGRIVVTFDPKGDARTVVTLEHQGLADAEATRQLKTYWRERLARLQELLAP